MIMRFGRLSKVMATAISLSAILFLYGCPAGMGPYFLLRDPAAAAIHPRQ